MIDTGGSCSVFIHTRDQKAATLLPQPSCFSVGLEDILNDVAPSNYYHHVGVN